MYTVQWRRALSPAYGPAVNGIASTENETPVGARHEPISAPKPLAAHMARSGGS